MKSYAQTIADGIAIKAIESYTNRLMIKYEIALEQETVGGAVSDIGIGFELAIAMLKDELGKARAELNEDM